MVRTQEQPSTKPSLTSEEEGGRGVKPLASSNQEPRHSTVITPPSNQHKTELKNHLPSSSAPPSRSSLQPSQEPFPPDLPELLTSDDSSEESSSDEEEEDEEVILPADHSWCSHTSDQECKSGRICSWRTQEAPHLLACCPRCRNPSIRYCSKQCRLNDSSNYLPGSAGSRTGWPGRILKKLPQVWLAS